MVELAVSRIQVEIEVTDHFVVILVFDFKQLHVFMPRVRIFYLRENEAEKLLINCNGLADHMRSREVLLDLFLVDLIRLLFLQVRIEGAVP